MILQISSALLLLPLLFACTARAQESVASAADRAVRPYKWIKLSDPQALERSIAYSSKPRPEDPGTFEKTVVARGALRFANESTQALGTFNGTVCRAIFTNDDRARRGTREIALEDCELLVAAPGYHAVLETIDEQELRRMSEAELTGMGAVPLEGILLAGRGGFSGFVARLSSERAGSLAGLYGIISSRPPAGAWRFLEVEKHNGQDGPVQILLIKKGEGNPDTMPGTLR